MITTIITTYRRPHLLRKAVASVLKQSYKNLQVCVYDNASGDETEQIMREFIQKDQRVKYHQHKENLGMMANYEFGFSHVKTPFFSFLSDDDYLLPHFFETSLEGFDRFPNAAFSACGVLQINEEGRIIGDPVSSWKKEGYYSVPEGIFEMTSSYGKLLLPTGIIFQHTRVKNILPDWSKELQARWDSDYLLQIAAQFPFIINKKSCAIFSVHKDSFSASTFSQLEEVASMDQYMIASNKLLTRFLDASHISSTIKSKISDNLRNMVRNEVRYFIFRFILQRKFIEACYSAKIVQKYYGVNMSIRFLCFLANLCRSIPAFSFLLYCVFFLLKRMSRFIKWVMRRSSTVVKVRNISN